jgi:hypothetical protein
MDYQFRLLIDGRLVAGASTYEVIDPATEERVDFNNLRQLFQQLPSAT